MSEVATQTELSQVLTLLQAMQTTLNTVQTDLQALTLEVKVNQAKTDERFKSMEEKIDLRFQAMEERIDLRFQALEEKSIGIQKEVADLRIQQRSTDNRILTFLFTAFITAVGLLTKVIFFDGQR
ncbi:hypothetical protein [Synechococcus sp. PCC 6312]|uniref:hypothetical protein n=1 Tax=Synechococcus sp. (strain ATCC 27167 / PCC 6312) TaxID=195253 RepID=UPI00029F4996|nr:hypothetical protein [Synechococcus sp. PCC 6312]AFY59647.1 hypothetical protein Syn6312_0418 [Synechococcus sp. PCC 6312]